MKNKLVSVVWAMCLAGTAGMTFLVVLFVQNVLPIMASLDSPEKVVASSVSQDRNYEAVISVVGGGAISSDVYRVRLRRVGDSGQGDQVAQVSQRTIFRKVTWRGPSLLIIERENHGGSSASDLESTDEWRDIRIQNIEVPTQQRILRLQGMTSEKVREELKRAPSR